MDFASMKVGTLFWGPKLMCLRKNSEIAENSSLFNLA